MALPDQNHNDEVDDYDHGYDDDYQYDDNNDVYDNPPIQLVKTISEPSCSILQAWTQAG